MDLPLELKNKIESLLLGYKLSELKEVATSLTNKYQNESGNNVSLISNELVAKVYTAIRMPATFSAYYQALSWTLDYFKDDIKSIIDIGSGTGSVAWAISNIMKFESIRMKEKEALMINLGEELLKDSPLSNKATYQQFDINKDELNEHADLVTSSYMLNEIKKEERAAVINKMWNATDKLLLVVEPGTPKGFEVIKEIRDILIDKGGYLVTPCPKMDKCPMLENDWCHFSTRINRSKLHRLVKNADAPYEDEKFTYIAFSKHPVDRCSARILRHPEISKSLIKLTVCDGSSIKKVEIRKSDDRYKKARKVKVGDYI